MAPGARLLKITTKRNSVPKSASVFVTDSSLSRLSNIFWQVRTRSLPGWVPSLAGKHCARVNVTLRKYLNFKSSQ
jgi:hypothetical protein